MAHESTADVRIEVSKHQSRLLDTFRKTSALALKSAIIAAIFLASWCRGLPGIVFMPYWYLSYSHGFVRRGLLGTIASPFLAGKPIGTAAHLVGIACIATTIAVVVCISITFARHVSRDPAIAAAVIIFAASPALSRLATDLGFPDIFLVGATVAALACENSDRTLWTTAICLVAPLIHEGFVFFCAPVLLGSIYLRLDRVTPRRLAPVAAMLFSTATVWFAASHHVTWASGVPIPQQDLNAFAAWELGQSAKLVGWPRPAILPTVLCALSVIVSATAAGRVAGTRYSIMTLAGALFTITIIAVAVDTDRLIAWAPVTALLMLAAALGASATGEAAASISG